MFAVCSTPLKNWEEKTFFCLNLETKKFSFASRLLESRCFDNEASSFVHLMVEKFAALMKHLLALMIGSIAVLLLLEIEAFFSILSCAVQFPILDSDLRLNFEFCKSRNFFFCWSCVESDWDRRSFFRPLMLKEFFFSLHPLSWKSCPKTLVPFSFLLWRRCWLSYFAWWKIS